MNTLPSNSILMSMDIWITVPIPKSVPPMIKITMTFSTVNFVFNLNKKVIHTNTLKYSTLIAPQMHVTIIITFLTVVTLYLFCESGTLTLIEYFWKGSTLDYALLHYLNWGTIVSSFIKHQHHGCKDGERSAHDKEMLSFFWHHTHQVMQGLEYYLLSWLLSNHMVKSCKEWSS